MRVPFFAVVLIGGLASPAHAQQWEYLTESSSRSIIYVDVQSIRDYPPIDIRRDFPVRRVWVRVDARNDRTVKFRSMVYLEAVDCQSDKSMTSQYIQYGPDGQVLSTRSFEDYSFNYEFVAPGTISHTIVEFACGRSALPRIGQ
jgi:hypothetical protein